ncbi:GNAT family N-acetyltransferase [Kaistia geumhonensis]|uniref:Ribosomal protein S18 acetylase RimI-like enzyme n=1 Tax=Kaistia geumhonensis TaxID=410839 RepID=A0ABU0M957_9HYPH|nr:GNAT family N-acetyltransferase [Kaistia geumhonensis]MCX5480838.1 GNAT family N-acetyltransferase [Kaistia geumhonensis]MDQ0517458.1 ribosomal protein S18 acetylase RimI-like enzyme [Kaistia geumhonensis]
MPEAILLRRAVASDRDALVAMQEAAYAPNRAILGGTPTPLTWDYGHVLATHEVWLAEDVDGIVGALIIEARPGDIYIHSIAVAPGAKSSGLGNRLLALAETRAAEEGRSAARLTANARMVFNIDWYGRKGYAVEEVEVAGDRRRVHMAKILAAPTAA